jgi:peroxiredoxin Q/BCP
MPKKKKAVTKKPKKKTAPKKRVAAKKPKVLAPKPGALAPDFRLPSDSGRDIVLSDYRGKNVILYFYPKDMTPGCTLEACDFEAMRPQLENRDAVIFGVSRDSVESHRKFKEKHSLGFPLLSDVDGKVCEAYGVWREKSLYGRKFMGIVRMTFLIDKAGKISKVYDQVKVNGHVADVKASL